MSGCSGREELAPPHGSLNRRGSRSEGKLNLALQERLAESERRKEKTPARDDTAKTKAGWVKAVPINIKYRPATAGSNQRTTLGRAVKPRPPTQLSVAKQNVITALRTPTTITTSVNTTTTTSIITQSSTISIPVQSGPTKPGTPLLPKYKTMPSPTRPPHALLGTPQLALNEIFEEVDGSSGGDNVGQSLSTRTFISRHQARGSSYEQRRSKFHKARTTSCSSSDASDDDSESRKKRAHKLNSTSKSLQQRRDSHDDSSDSRILGEEPGVVLEVVGAIQLIIRFLVVDPPRPLVWLVFQKVLGHLEVVLEDGSVLELFRIHHWGDGIALADVGLEKLAYERVSLSIALQKYRKRNTSSPKIKGFGARLLQSWSLTSTSRKSAVLEEKGNLPTENSTLQVGCALSRNDREKIKLPTTPDTEGPELATVHSRTEKENFCKSGKSKSLRDKQQEGGGKKVRLLGRYFQVHKKLCIPLPGFFGRGRLYKAQSCGSIVRDRVTPPPAASLLLCGDDRWQQMAGKTDVGRSRAGQGNSNTEEDVNRNVGIVATEGIAAACPGIGMCHIHLGNASKCCNFC
ncbi:hypothetical protein PR048_022078 [Dryococelus australis]|uniref:Uncharacterized protein n=1 Tax=Dryococelus australis TaxID=614101 RepID=A0ABQ9H011_9NEOP|nr:hypothetical protein PR048_022078 [Dryococelus australis]